MCLANVVEESHSGDMLRRLLRFSDWHQLKKVVAWLLCARPTHRDTGLFLTKPPHYKPRPISLDEIEKAEIVVLKLIQRDTFFKGIETIRERQKHERKEIGTQRSSRMKRSRQLARFDPCLDGKGLLRVGGRIRRRTEASNHYSKEGPLYQLNYQICSRENCSWGSWCNDE